MADDKKPNPLTPQMCFIFSNIYLLIAFAFLGIIREDQSALRVTGYYLFFGVASVASAACIVLA
jgi:hypothetical protein